MEQGRVIVVVDSGLLQVNHGGQAIAFDALVAARLAGRMRIDLRGIDGAPRLDDVVSRYLLQPRARKEDLYHETMLKDACKTVGRNLDCAEWQQFLGGVPYRKTCPDLPAPVCAP